MPAGARKCTECDEYQSIGRRMLAGLDLQALIALIPIGALAFAFLQSRLETKASDLRLALVSCTQDGVTIFASNLGNRAAIVRNASYRVNGREPRALDVHAPSDARLLEGGDTRAFELNVIGEVSPGGLVPFDVRTAPGGCSVAVTVSTIAFDQSEEPREVTCDCPR